MKTISVAFAFLILPGLAGCGGGETLHTSYLDIGSTPALTKATALNVLRASAADTDEQPCDVRDDGIVGYEGYVLPSSGQATIPFGDWRYSAQASELRRGKDETVDEAWHAIALTTRGAGKSYHCNALRQAAPGGIEPEPGKRLQRVVGALRSLGVTER